MVANEIATKDDLENVVQKLQSVIANEIKKNCAPMIRVYDVEGAAEFLKCSKVTVRRRAANGEIAYIKEGKDLKFLESDLVAYLMKKRVLSFDELRATA